MSTVLTMPRSVYQLSAQLHECPGQEAIRSPPGLPRWTPLRLHGPPRDGLRWAMKYAAAMPLHEERMITCRACAVAFIDDNAAERFKGYILCLREVSAQLDVCFASEGGRRHKGLTS